MTQQEAIDALKSRFEKIRATFDIAIVYLDAEDIHNFRVEVKKLRAFLRMASGHERIKLPRGLHQFYRIAGEIRNLQLQEERIRDAFRHKSSPPQFYLTLLGIKAANHIRRARKFAASQLSIAADKERLLQALSDGLNKNSIREFAHDSIRLLQTFADHVEPIGDDTLHSLRKCLKGLLYNQPCIQKEAAHLLPSELTTGKDTLTALIDLLGQYQDLRTGLFLLRPRYVDQVPDANERKKLQGVRTQWENDKAAIKHQILARQLLLLNPPAYAFART
jgi:CHAD domain-containing protein